MADPAQIRVRSFGDVADVIPYVLGFEPTESVVVMLTDPVTGAAGVTARVDLADAARPGQIEDLLDSLWSQHPNSAGLIVAYTSHHTDGWDLTHRAIAYQPRIITQGVVDGDTWYTPDGDTGRRDRYSRVATAATYAGLTRASSRADLEAALASPPDSPELIERLDQVIDTLPAANQTGQLATTTKQLIDRTLTADTLSERDALTLAALVHHPVARDTALLTMTRDDSGAHARLWRKVIQQAPESVTVPPLFLAGMAAWMTGDGATANICHDQAVRLTPPGMPSAVTILAALNEAVVPPTAWAELRADGLAQALPDVRHAVLGTPTPRWETVTPPHPDGPRPEPPATNPNPGLNPGYGI